MWGAIMILLLSSALFAQGISMRDGFMGRGVSPIYNGDAETARQKALTDAQRKTIVEALSNQLPLEVMEKHFLLLKTLFFDQPNLYLQSYKIIYENSIYDTYQLAIQGLVQQEMLRKDLEAIGLLGPKKEKIGVLFMIAEKVLGSSEYFYWWSPTEASSFVSISEQKMKEKFLEKGYKVIDPFQTVHELSTESLSQSHEPDLEMISLLGSQCNAEIVILGKTELQKSRKRTFSSLTGVQSSMNVTAISVRQKEILVRAASYGLGVHIDEDSASKEAIENACSKMAEQIIEKLMVKLQREKEQLLQVKVSAASLEENLQPWIESFQRTFPEVKEMEIVEEQEHLLLTIKVPVDITSMLEKIFEVGIDGYKTEVITTSENFIEFMVTPEQPKPDLFMNFTEVPQSKPLSENQTEIMP
jgi:hypothetical protein